MNPCRSMSCWQTTGLHCGDSCSPALLAELCWEVLQYRWEGGSKRKKEKLSNDNTQENYIRVKSERNKYNKLCVRACFLSNINGTNGRKIFSSSLLYHDSSQIKLHMYLLGILQISYPIFKLAKKFKVIQN